MEALQGKGDYRAPAYVSCDLVLNANAGVLEWWEMGED